jgi:XTP/dITP diphosphohydrolase
LKIVLATHNREKMEEISDILVKLPVEILTLDSFPNIGEIPETGNTLKKNAFIKAETVFELTGLPSLADDTGLEVDALSGAPGVYSARYAGEEATYQDNCKKMLNEMKSFSTNDRIAYFRTVIAFVTNSEKIWTEGVVKGTILDHQDGEKGFGYDSIFYYPPLEKTFAAMKKDEKNSISHRGKALRNFCNILEKKLINKNG